MPESTEPTARILVIDDDPIARRIAVAVLADAGYEPLESEDGQSGLSVAFTLKPDCVLLDGRLPDMDGLEVLQQLRGHFTTTHIPVVMVTARSALADRIDGLETGADDYVTKPYDRRELTARIASILRRTTNNMAADPLTKLPGNAVLRDHLEQRLAAGLATSVAYIDLDNFKAYVDAYGFEAASRVILGNARLLYNAVVDLGEPTDFVGHIGGDDFLLIGEPESVPKVVERLVTSFDEAAPGWYRAEDALRGYIEGNDRYGVERRFPIVSLSVAIIGIAAGAKPDSVSLAKFAGACKGDVKGNRGCGWREYPYEPPAVS